MSAYTDAKIAALLVRVETAEAALAERDATIVDLRDECIREWESGNDWCERAVRAERERDEAQAALREVAEMCFRDGYTTWDVDEHLPGQGWKPDDPKVLAWEAAHGHDARLKCYPEFGCQLLLDPEDVLDAIPPALRAVLSAPPTPKDQP